MSTSFTVHGTPKDANGCALNIPNWPFHGDLYFADCPVKICGDVEIYGSIHIQAGCTVTITGDLTLHQIGESEIPANTLYVSGNSTFIPET